MNTRTLTISSISAYRYKQTPLIRLSGDWLRQLGFEIGSKIEVEQKQEQLLIRLVPKKDDKEVQGRCRKTTKSLNNPSKNS
jgi:antitoxin component of MazEF toxin-antitoxin module